jgi:hypothetical protein
MSYDQTENTTEDTATSGESYDTGTSGETTDDTAGTPDEVGPAAEVVPGVGPVPEAEAEGFRDEQIKREDERRKRVEQDNAERSEQAKEFYSGGAAREDEQSEGEATSAP